MAIYAIHCPPLAGDREAAALASRVTKLGFSYPAFVLGPFWLAALWLWRPLVVYVAAAALVGFLTASGVFAGPVVIALEILAGILIGLEGRNWLGAALTRRGLPLVDIIEARNADEAARVYFTRALAAVPPSGARIATSRASSGVIGSLPEAQR